MTNQLDPIMAMIAGCSSEGVVELERALTGLLRRTETPRERRVRELLPLAQLLESAHATCIPRHPVAEVRIERKAYDRLRPNGAPSSEALADRFGGEGRAGWLHACRAAHGLLPDGRKRGASVGWAVGVRGNTRPRRDLGRAEVIASIRACALALGSRPNSQVYEEWVAGRRRTARQRGGAPAVDKLALRRMRQVYDQFPDWETALRAADVTDAELAAVRAKRLAPANEATAAEAPATPAERLAALLPEQLQEAGLSEIERDRLVPRGLGKLPLSRAAVLAHALGGSLGWLAGRVSKPGEPANPQARLSQKALTEARQRSGLREEYLWRRAKLGEAEWWDLMRGVREPTLGQLAKWAELTSVSVVDLVELR